MSSFGRCKGCGKTVIWIKTKAGKNMPVDAHLHNFKVDHAGKEKIVTQEGDVITGTTGVGANEADGIGYISHFATCPNARRFRKSNS